MNFAALAIRNRVTTMVLTVVLFAGGVVSFNGLARLEDPEFTIKEALVITPYPGATAQEVQTEVSDKIEQAVQKLGQLKEVESKSDRGLSTVTVRIKDQYDKSSLPQVWDEVRRKVSDVQGQLPPGAGPSIVNDDFGDVWGVFVAIYGDEYSDAELKAYAKFLRRELLLVHDVAKIDFWGQQTEAVYVEPNRDRISQLGIHPQIIIDALRDKNLVADAGHVDVGPERIAVQPTGTFQRVQDFEDLLISGTSSGGEGQIYLRDVAKVRRGYMEPYGQVLHYDGHRALGIGIATVAGGNVVAMGEAVEKRARELLAQTPLGIEFGIISLQSDAVTTAIDNFLWSLVEAVVIVIVVLLVFMGLRSGLIIGFVLALTILGTFIFMGPWHVALERISLGALIIALGMLVDNAIVVVDGVLVRVQKGEDASEAAQQVVAQTALPLLGATAVAIMAFGAIGLSDDSTGEFCRSLFQVVLISLGLSWITAVTVTPVLCVMFLHGGVVKTREPGTDPQGAGFYARYSSFLAACIRRRWLTVLVVLVMFGASLFGFRYVGSSFFPNSTRPQFIMDFWLPQGTRIEDTLATAASVEGYLLELEGATHVTTMAGAGGMRFILTYAPEKPNSAYVQFLVDVDDYRLIDGMMAEVEDHLIASYPDAEVFGRKFGLGPGSGGKIQVRFSGPDANELRRLAEAAEVILREDGDAKAIRSDWRQRVKVVEPVIAEAEASYAGLSTSDVALAVKSTFEGARVGVFREGDELLPILLRAPGSEREDVSSIQNIQIWSPAAGASIPIGQVVSGFETKFEDSIIQRLNRKPTITVHADPVSGNASDVLGRVKPRIDALEMGPEYEIDWWGEYRDASRAQRGIAASLPFFVLFMVLIVVALFNSLRQPLAIWLCVPLALIGVTAGLLLTGQPFGFMALLGFLSLSGMLVKNAIVLIDEIELLKRAGAEVYDAITQAGVSRLRPVAMAALTTALGMIPLLLDPFFIAMAVTIIFGLMVATVLTMVVVPVLYAILFRVPTPGPA